MNASISFSPLFFASPIPASCRYCGRILRAQVFPDDSHGNETRSTFLAGSTYVTIHINVEKPPDRNLPT
jgi:hypothetical protein